MDNYKFRIVSHLQKPKNGRLRFNMEDDLRTLREVALQNPFADSSRWRSVHHNVTSNWKPFSIRGVREHVEHLLKLFTKKDAVNICKGGNATQFREKTKLLSEIKQMQVDARREIYPTTNVDVLHDAIHIMNSLSPRSPTSMPDDAEIPMVQDADQFLSTTDVKMLPQSIHSPTHSSTNLEEEEVEIDTKSNIQLFHNIPDSAGDLFNNLPQQQSTYSEQNYSDCEVTRKRLELDERRMTLEERRLALEEKKFEAERAERAKRLELECREREDRLRLREKQQDLIKLLILQLQKD